MRQAFIFAGCVAVMLGWVWLWGLMATGNARQATRYLRDWWRIIKWTIVAGAVVGLAALQLIGPP